MTYLVWGIAAVAPLPRNDTLFYVILNEVKNPTDELTVHIFLTKVVGYFAIAQYDVKKTAWDISLRSI